jgi:hypothetical protein
MTRIKLALIFRTPSNQCLPGAVSRPRKPKLVFDGDEKMKIKMITTALTLSLAAGVANAEVPAGQGRVRVLEPGIAEVLTAQGSCLDGMVEHCPIR